MIKGMDQLPLLLVAYLRSAANKINISEKTKHQAINLMNDVVNSGISAGKDLIVAFGGT